MATINDLKFNKPLFLIGRQFKQVDDPELTALAEKMNLPQLLICADFVDGAQITLPPEDMRAFMAHIIGTGRQADFERDLQCVSEDGEGSDPKR